MSISEDNYIGEPGYPAPWTTSAPREGLRDTDQARIISLAPDVCRSPGTPVPYPVVDFCGHDQNYTASVRFTGQKAMVMRSNTSHVHGDEPGIGKGIKSNTVGGISEPITHAANVRAEGSHVIRHLDRFYMNNRNTIGEALFVRDTRTFAAPQNDDPLPGSMASTMMPFEPYQLAQAATGTMTDAAPSSLGSQAGRSQSTGGVAGTASNPSRRGLFGKSLQIGLVDALTGGKATQRRIENVLAGLDFYATTPGKGLNPAQMNVYAQAASLIRERALPVGDLDLARAIEGRVPFVLPGEDITGLTDQQIRDRLLGRVETSEPAPNEPDPEEEPPARPDPLGPSVTVTISAREEYRRRCQIDRYAVMKNVCGKYGMQAHHIVPDWTLRYGTRGESNKRIPNMPSLSDGMTICVMGHASKDETEHNKAHFADAAIETLGENSTPPFTATLADVQRESVLAMTLVRPDCRAQILAAVQGQYGNQNQSQLLRAKRLPPLPSETVEALRTGAVRAIP